MTGLVVGMHWRGVGADEIAASLPDTRSLNLWNLTSRIDRAIMGSPAENAVARHRLHRAVRSVNGDTRAFAWALVTCPHRLTAPAMQELRRSSTRLVALLGDEPCGSRAIEQSVLDHFDLVSLADPRWQDSLPAHTPVTVEPWRSTLPIPKRRTHQIYRPEKLAFVGSPYAERTEMMRTIAPHFPSITIGSWPQAAGVHQVPAISRHETIAVLRQHKALVVNMHHRQFTTGLNPQFFDYAISGIPQLIAGAHSQDLFLPRLANPWNETVTNPFDDSVHEANRTLFDLDATDLHFIRTAESLVTL